MSNRCGSHDQNARMNQLFNLRPPSIGELQEASCCNSQEPKDLYTLIDNVMGWHYDRNLIEGSTDKDQVLKLAQELGELSDSVCKGNDIRDDIGDMLVVMLNIAERNGVILAECLNQAWNDIKNRKGRMVDGIFVKTEADL